MKHPATTATRATGALRRAVLRRASERLGGGARAKVVFLLACVLALESADAATIGATAIQLEHSLNIGNAEVGLLVSVSTGVGALATLPAGALTDRVDRTQMLSLAILAWAVAMALGGLAPTYVFLLCTRIALGAVVATAGPTVASLIGDYFPVAERGQIYGYILSGELIGAGVGLLLSGDIAAALSWRYAFWVLAVPSVVLSWAIWQRLPEPARDGSSRLMPAGSSHPFAPQDEHASQDGQPDDQVTRETRRHDVSPRDPLVLHEDPTRRPLWWAVKYVLSIRTNRVLIVASALGFFFFSGLRTFAVVFLRGRYDVGQSVANIVLFAIGVGAVLGALLGGRIADRLLGRGRLTARPVVAGAAFLVAAVCFLPGLNSTSLLLAAPLFFLAALGLGGSNPPLDGARLDLMPARLWGRAEAVRTVLRYALGAVAPVLFGWVSAKLGGVSPGPATGASHQPVSAQAANGLADAFSVMLVPLLIAGVLIVVWARRTYPRDVATAIASDEEIGRADEPENGHKEAI
ncbi:MAG TPA: MFS transporter [Nocardioidaceae bacterium]|nr:MFS transporter [Nocardioidaceae bacterium]